MQNRYFSPFVVATTAFLLVAATPSPSATVEVGSSHSFRTIQEGLDASAVGDTVLVHPGTYRELIVMPIDRTLISDRGPWETEIRPPAGYPTFAILSVESGADRSTVVDGFLFRDGLFNGGGAMHCSFTNPSIKNNIFLRNEGVWGAAIRLKASSAHVHHNILIRNEGPSMRIDGDMNMVERNLFLWNETTLVAGAIVLTWYNDKTVPDTIRVNQFVGNVARTKQAGAVNIFDKPAIVEGNVFWRNRANFGGGALAIRGMDGVVRGNLFAENEAGTFDWASQRHGGGLVVSESQGVLVINNTFVGNRVVSASPTRVGAALHDHKKFEPDPYADDVRILNNIFFSNRGGAAIGRSTSVGPHEYNLLLGHNLFWANERGAYGDDVFGGEGDMHAAPELVGAVRGLLALSASSPAIDAGRTDTWDADSTVADLGFIATNQNASVITAWDRRYSESPELHLEAWDGGRIAGQLQITMRDADACVVWQHRRTFDHPGPVLSTTVPLNEAHVSGRAVVLDAQLEWDGEPMGEALVAVDASGGVMSLNELESRFRAPDRSKPVAR